MRDAVQTFCGECDKTMFLSELKDHILSQHELSLSEYKRFYRKPSTQLIRPTYHKCNLCWKDIVLDKTRIVQHMQKSHSGNSFAEYKHQFLAETSTNGKGQELVSMLSNPAASMSPSKKKPSSQPQKFLSRRAPWPECSTCGRNFKSNMHLKMHIRREHLWSAHLPLSSLELRVTLSQWQAHKLCDFTTLQPYDLTLQTCNLSTVK